MIQFKKFKLSNDLRILVHEDPSTPMVSVCMTYNVGTKHEHANRTGLAHLFEHLMFAGTHSCPDFDEMIQDAGGENNAFTNHDMTVYYEYLPKENLEVALFLEADRMRNLKLTPELFEKEKKVVLEEFNESCLNEPYGDIWHHIGPLAYGTHPYSFPTIGVLPVHIKDAQLKDARAFYDRYYCPSNAVLSISGNFDSAKIASICKKYFEDIESGKPMHEDLDFASYEFSYQAKDVYAEVPMNALFLIFRSAKRNEKAYYIDDFITDILAEGDTARLYIELVKEKAIFSSVDAYITSSIDTGLLIIEAKLLDHVDFDTAENEIWKLLNKMKCDGISENMVQKFRNRIEHSIEFSEINNLHKAINLGYYEVLADASLVNEEKSRYASIEAEEVIDRLSFVFDKDKYKKIRYHSVSND